MGAVPLGGRPPMAPLPPFAIIGIRHFPLAAPRKRYIRLARRRKGASSFFLAAQESASGTKRTRRNGLPIVRFRGKADKVGAVSPSVHRLWAANSGVLGSITAFHLARHSRQRPGWPKSAA